MINIAILKKVYVRISEFWERRGHHEFSHLDLSRNSPWAWTTSFLYPSRLENYQSKIARKATNLGLIMAMLLRIILLFGLVFLASLQEPLFHISGSWIEGGFSCTKSDPHNRRSVFTIQIRDRNSS
jgi:hypothetical protein